MTRFQIMLLTLFIGCPFCVGCGGNGGTPAPAASENEIQAYVNANPDSAAGLEPEGGTEE